MTPTTVADLRKALKTTKRNAIVQTTPSGGAFFTAPTGDYMVAIVPDTRNNGRRFPAIYGIGATKSAAIQDAWANFGGV